MSDVVLELRGVSKAFGGHVVLDDVSFAVARGEVVGVAGPSGAGKSTLLRVAAGIDAPTGGQVLARGESIWRPGAHRATQPAPGFTGMVFQDPAGSLDPAWTVRRILTEPFRAAGRPRTTRASREEQIAAMLGHVGLADVPRETRPGQLSGGQQQRIALARCLLGTPSVVLADEPTSALDVTNAAGVMHLLRSTADSGVAIVLVSHDRLMLEAVADRIVECRGSTLVPAGDAA